MGKRKKTGRGRPSTIDQLPEDIKVNLNADLRDRRLSQKAILAEVNSQLAERGEDPISKSAINRYSLAIEEKGSMMREAREAANALVGNLSESKGTDLGRALSEMIKTVAFDMVMKKDEVDLKTLDKLALVTQRIERASKISLEREADLRKQVLLEAAETIEETAIQQGMDIDQAGYWREQVLGMK